MEDLTKLAGKPGEQFNQGESMSAGNTISTPAYGSAPGSAPVDPKPGIGREHDSPEMEISPSKDLTHKVSASDVKASSAEWKKAGE